MKKFIVMLFVVALVSGCAGNHCSRTNFTGKTKGFNPYGDGTIDRESYWGNMECIGKLIDKVYQKPVETIKEEIEEPVDEKIAERVEEEAKLENETVEDNRSPEDTE